MALRYSEGLLSGLRNFGQSPTRQVNQTLAQPVDTSQALAASLGGLFGVDMRSPQAQQQAQLQQQVSKIKDPSSYEGMVQLAQAIMPIDPIQGAQLLAKAEEQRKALQQKEQQTQRETEALKANIESSTLPKEKKELLLKNYTAGITSAADTLNALQPPDPKERYAVVGNSVFDFQERKYMSKEEAPETAKPLTGTQVQKLYEAGEITRDSFIEYTRSGKTESLQFTEPTNDVDKEAEYLISEATNVIKNAEMAMNKAPESFIEASGQALAQIIGVPWSDGVEIEGYVDQIQANLAFDKLQRMRDASKTGGALGQVSNIELNLLKSSVTALNPKSGNFKQQLQTVIDHYGKFVDILEKGKSGSTQIPTGYEIIGNEAYRVVEKNGKKFYQNEDGEFFQFQE